MANRSILGVRYQSLRGCFCGSPSLSASMGTDVSINPISSTRNRMMLGFCLEDKFRKSRKPPIQRKKDFFMVGFLFPLGQNLTLLNWPPLANLCGKSRHHFRIVFGQVLFFLRIFKQVEQLWSLFFAWMCRLVTVNLPVIGEQKFADNLKKFMSTDWL